MPILAPIANRYTLDAELGAGGMGAVYRATDQLTREIVALKRVKLAPNQLQFASRAGKKDPAALRLALAQEFRTLATLRHPHIISVLDYGFDHDQQPFFTMTLLDQPQTLVEYGKSVDTHTKTHLLIQTLQALTYLHRRNIFHRDLKPGNVLVTRDGQVKVLDFGLAATTEQAQGIAGTLAYMSPEVLHEQPLTEASDVYAVGVMAYELFVGRHPIQVRQPMRVMWAIMHTEPDLSDVDDPDLRDVLSIWLEKDPADRYPTADAALNALCAAVGIDPPVESAAIRESFLQASAFIGRDAQLQRLQTAIEALHRGGRAFYLVGGESGVGKSRLLDETRIAALVSGATVLIGRSAEAGMPFQLWRDILKRLLLTVPITDLQAAVLKPIVPDLSALLGRDVPAAPMLNGSAYQQRLVLTIVDLIKKVNHPLVLILEDLQWADASLEPLIQLLKISEQLNHLMIVGSYRNDEAPTLPDTLNGMTVITLERLNTDAIRKLGVSMLGEQAAQDQVVALLQHETEGNLFFLVETVRALAEEAGGLTHIGETTLPTGVFTGGMHKLLSRRLNKVDHDYQPIQTLAAILGREIDLKLLAHCCTNEQVEAWVLQAHSAAVLEIQDNKWFFAHDKLREMMIRSLPEDHKPQLYQQAAETIEHVYPDDDGYAEMLMNHWQAAGNTEREAYYAHKFAMQHVHYSTKYQAAVDLLQHALTIAAADQQAPLLRDLSRAYYTSGKMLEAEDAALRALRLTSPDDADLRSEIYARLCGSYQARGHSRRSLAYARLALIYGEDSGVPHHIARGHMNIGNAYRKLGNYRLATAYMESAYRRFKALNDTIQILNNVNNLGVLYMNRGLFDQAVAYYQETIRLSAQIGERFGEAAANTNLGNIYGWRGEYELGQQVTQRGYELFVDMGEMRGVAVTLSNLGRFAGYLGDADSGRDYIHRAIAIHEQAENIRSIGLCHQYLGEIDLSEGKTTEARQCFEEALTRFKQIDYQEGVAGVLLNIGLTCIHENNKIAALPYIQESLAINKSIDTKDGIAYSQVLLSFITDDIPHQRVVEALHIAQQLAIPWLIGAVVLIAARRAWRVDGDLPRAVEYTSAVHHAVNMLNIYQPLQHTLERELAAVLPEADYNAAWELGKTRSLDQIAAHISND